MAKKFKNTQISVTVPLGPAATLTLEVFAKEGEDLEEIEKFFEYCPFFPLIKEPDSTIQKCVNAGFFPTRIEVENGEICLTNTHVLAGQREIHPACGKPWRTSKYKKCSILIDRV